MQYTAKEVLEILAERLSRDINVLESQIKHWQLDKPATVPVLLAVLKSFIDAREITVKSFHEFPEI
jgi:hypothetical protein